jgi:hypothetical protein
MRSLLALMCLCFALGSSAEAVEGRVFKVLPQFLDQKGLPAQTPSLYDRDAYQAFLRKHPEKRSAFRFAIQWKASAPESEPLKLHVELLGIAKTDTPKQTTLDLTVHQQHRFSHWSYISLSEDDYKAFGEITAWRVTLWDGDQLLGEQKSFLWQNLPPSTNTVTK